MKYFARVTAGLEQVAWREIEQRTQASLSAFEKRRIDFSYSGDPASLLTLRSVDDMYVYVAQFNGIDHTRQSLPLLAQKMQQVDFIPALDVCATIRHIRPDPRYSITSSLLGKRNYSRYDVEDVVHTALATCLPWQFVPNRADEHDIHDIDLRMLLEDERVIIGIRLSETPLHRRDYKVESVPGSLKAPVAFCMCLLAALGSDDVVVDPMCGAGTILLEARALSPHGIIIGGDMDERTIEAARKNATAGMLSQQHEPPGFFTDSQNLTGAIATAQKKQAGALFLYQGDASALPLPATSVQAVITNAPWGQQVSQHVDLAALYTRIVKEIERVLAPSGRAVILTDQDRLFQDVLAKTPRLFLVSTLQISLFGRHPTLYIIEK